MSRNIIVFLASVMIVVMLFVGYAALVRDPSVSDPDRDAAADVLPPAGNVNPAAAIDFGAGRVPGGGGVEMTIYDEHSGRATDRLRVGDWQPVPGSKNEIQVTSPELALLLPSGMSATITAESGRLTADRVQRQSIRPKFGTLSGNAKIVIDRATEPNRRPAAERTEDFITIRMDTMDFDLELGQLNSAARVVAEARDFRIAGTGLKLAWNQADNVVDTLRIERGEELVVLGGAGLFDNMTGTKTPATSGGAATKASDKAVASSSPARRSPIARKSTTYLCVLTGDVSAQHYRGEQNIGSITADELRLLFDAGSAAGLGAPDAATTQPTSAAASQPAPNAERLVVRWSGPLLLTPERGAPRNAAPRRRIEAIGRPVRLTSADGSAVCGRLEYHDDSKQIWLQPVTPGGRVDFSADDRTNASANSVYVDRRKNIIKLIGDVALISRKSANDPRPFRLRCSDWAELLLTPSDAEDADVVAPTEALALNKLRSGAFFGAVQVDMGEQTLVANELQTLFDSTGESKSLETALQTATAVGEVRLRGEEQSLRCGRLTLTFATTPQQELYPRRMEAFGAVRIDRGGSIVLDALQRGGRNLVGLPGQRGGASVTGERVDADFEPVPRDEAVTTGGAPAERRPATRFALRNLAITGHAELRDPENAIAARGEWIAAAFENDNQLRRATVSDPGGNAAAVYSRPYTVRGSHIVLDGAAEALQVEGASRLSFPSTRSFQGAARATALPVVITSSRSLSIDSRANAVQFSGDVVARSGTETLKADTMTLLLEDAAAPASANRTPAYAAWYEGVRSAIDTARRARRPTSALVGTGVSPERRTRKEPLRLIARNAVITSETFEPGRRDPIGHMSIAAPELNAEIPQRIIRTLGQTTLFMNSRQLGGDEAAERAATGLPSAMISRGPNQTAMQADGAMTYVIGPEGPQRRDTVLFEGGVFFVHKAGREMVDFETLFPEIVRDPTRLAQIKSRNTRLQCRRLECEFVSGDAAGTAGSSTTRPALAQPGNRSMRLSWLLASGEVHLRDVQGAGIRTVQAERAEFDRTRSAILVSGTDSTDARVFYENPETGEFSEPAVGREFEIDLERNTVKSQATRGEFRRP